MEYPQMVKVKQQLANMKLNNIDETVYINLDKVDLANKLKPGQTVAITVGSRGIKDINKITKALVDYLKRLGVSPFIIPAMGSHGGATSEGQKEVLAHYGVTEDYLGVPIKATMDVVEIGETVDGVKVFLDKFAHTADHIIVMNRVKPHTDFFGDIESGLHKIMAIGLGKHKGAQYYHQAAVKYGLERIIYTVGQTVLNNSPVLCGLGIIENGYDQTAEIEVLLPQDFEEGEKRLLEKAKDLIARLPFQDIDLLIIDQIGKNISGTGMDTNVVGRLMSIYSSEPEYPKIKRIIVSDLTEETEGNALGIGAADFCNSRIIEKLNRNVMYTNAITGLCPEKARLPISFPTDKEVLQVALKTIGTLNLDEARIIHIKSTLHLEYIELSTSFLEEIKGRSDLKIVGEPYQLGFDKNDNFLPVTNP